MSKTNINSIFTLWWAGRSVILFKSVKTWRTTIISSLEILQITSYSKYSTIKKWKKIIFFLVCVCGRRVLIEHLHFYGTKVEVSICLFVPELYNIRPLSHIRCSNSIHILYRKSSNYYGTDVIYICFFQHYTTFFP